MNCPYCQSANITRNGLARLQNGISVQRYCCLECGRRFNERTGTPMARLRTPTATVSMAMNVRTEGMGARATARTLEKSHSTILRWEQRLAQKCADWSPPAPSDNDITLEGDELYTRVHGNFPPSRLGRLDN